jgi:hypothetical protein
MHGDIVGDFWEVEACAFKGLKSRQWLVDFVFSFWLIIDWSCYHVAQLNNLRKGQCIGLSERQWKREWKCSKVTKSNFNFTTMCKAVKIKSPTQTIKMQTETFHPVCWNELPMWKLWHAAYWTTKTLSRSSPVAHPSYLSPACSTLGNIPGTNLYRDLKDYKHVSSNSSTSLFLSFMSVHVELKSRLPQSDLRDPRD